MSVFGNAISESNKAVTALEGTPSASGVERGNYRVVRQVVIVGERFAHMGGADRTGDIHATGDDVPVVHELPTPQQAEKQEEKRTFS